MFHKNARFSPLPQPAAADVMNTGVVLPSLAECVQGQVTHYGLSYPRVLSRRLLTPSRDQLNDNELCFSGWRVTLYHDQHLLQRDKAICITVRLKMIAKHHID